MISVTKTIRRYLSILLAALLLGACSKDDDKAGPPEPAVPDRPKVTLMTTVNGLGDNGYNDAMLDGLYLFNESSGMAVELLHPYSMEQAETMYQQWLTNHAQADSCVLIVASSTYEQLVSRTPVSLKGSGSRILLLESQATIPGVSTLYINRYGASYMAGALLGGYPAYVLAACPGIPAVETSIQGFRDGHAAYAGQYPDVAVEYLADGEEGFAMPDSAYNMMARHMDETQASKSDLNGQLYYAEAVFPLLGSSFSGALRAHDDNILSVGLMVGIDRDRQGQSPCIPFSHVVRIDSVIVNYLSRWVSGEAWPPTATLGLKDGAADIVVNQHYTPRTQLMIFDYEIKSHSVFSARYPALKTEAIQKEAAYDNRQQKQ